MTTQYINNVGVFSFGKILAVICGILGLIAGFFMSLITLGMGLMMGYAVLNIGLVSVFGAIIVMPILCTVIGYVGGAIIAMIFNVITGFVGGLEVDIE